MSGITDLVPETALTPAALAAQPRWPPAQVFALQGHCAGGLLKDWAAHIKRRWGADAEARVRAKLGEYSANLPAAPAESSWLPVFYQVRTTDIIIEEFLAGDALALEPLLWEDSQHSGAALNRVLRWIGPGLFFRKAHAIHKKLYDLGEVQAQVSQNHAQFTYQGTPLFGNPTWQLLQLFAVRLFLRALHRETLDLYLHQLSPDTFELFVQWR